MRALRDISTLYGCNSIPSSILFYNFVIEHLRICSISVTGNTFLFWKIIPFPKLLNHIIRIPLLFKLSSQKLRNIRFGHTKESSLKENKSIWKSHRMHICSTELHMTKTQSPIFEMFKHLKCLCEQFFCSLADFHFNSSIYLCKTELHEECNCSLYLPYTQIGSVLEFI